MAKTPQDPISVRMWVLKNPDSVFFYVQHALMDFNSQTQDDISFTLGIQTPWQLEIMQKFGHGSVLSFDRTFGTNQSKVHLFCYCMKCHIINMFHNIVTNVGIMFFAIPFVHPNGVCWMAKWDIGCIHCHWKKSKKWPWPSSSSTIKMYAKQLDA